MKFAYKFIYKNKIYLTLENTIKHSNTYNEKNKANTY